jgi:hypothetical protein
LYKEEEIGFEREGPKCTNHYIVQGDGLIVYLPDGSQRTTILSGLDLQMVALTHLRGLITVL